MTSCPREHQNYDFSQTKPLLPTHQTTSAVFTLPIRGQMSWLYIGRLLVIYFRVVVEHLNQQSRLHRHAVRYLTSYRSQKTLFTLDTLPISQITVKEWFHVWVHGSPVYDTLPMQHTKLFVFVELLDFSVLTNATRRLYNQTKSPHHLNYLQKYAVTSSSYQNLPRRKTLEPIQSVISGTWCQDRDFEKFL